MSTSAQADHNSLGKTAFIIGLIALVLSFPLAILFGLIALGKASRFYAIAELVTGGMPNRSDGESSRMTLK